MLLPLWIVSKAHAELMCTQDEDKGKQVRVRPLRARRNLVTAAAILVTLFGYSFWLIF